MAPCDGGEGRTVLRLTADGQPLFIRLHNQAFAPIALSNG
jgi:hypothetical protein